MHNHYIAYSISLLCKCLLIWEREGGTDRLMMNEGREKGREGQEGKGKEGRKREGEGEGRREGHGREGGRVGGREGGREGGSKKHTFDWLHWFLCSSMGI